MQFCLLSLRRADRQNQETGGGFGRAHDGGQDPGNAGQERVTPSLADTMDILFGAAIPLACTNPPAWQASVLGKVPSLEWQSNRWKRGCRSPFEAKPTCRPSVQFTPSPAPPTTNSKPLDGNFRGSCHLDDLGGDVSAQPQLTPLINLLVVSFPISRFPSLTSQRLPMEDFQDASTSILIILMPWPLS